jgi:hypothetical protein
MHPNPLPTLKIETCFDSWEAADFQEEAAREKAKSAKKDYESALRHEFFNF